jgi:hypothetical protein
LATRPPVLGCVIQGDICVFYLGFDEFYKVVWQRRLKKEQPFKFMWKVFAPLV